MLKSVKARWKRAVSGLLAVIMAVGMLPVFASAADSSGGSNPYAPNGDFELNVAGSTAWNGGSDPLTVYKTESRSTQVTTIPAAVPFALLEDRGGDRLKIGYVADSGWTGSTLDGTGWVDKDSVLVNLPDLLPSIAYESDSSEQFNSRLTRFEYVIPGSYALAEQLALLQREAMSSGETLVVRQSGQTVSVSRAKGGPAQLHSYTLDGVTYQKYDTWTEYEASDDSLSDLSYELPFSVDRAYSADPSVTLTVFCPQTVKRAPSRVSASDPTGGVGAYNPGSPGGKKPTTSNVAWATDPERTFLRFTLLEFPQGVVTDLNTGDWNTWHVVGTPLNVVWSRDSSGNTWSADRCRSSITWYNSCAMQFNAKGSSAPDLMGGSFEDGGVYSYDATAGRNRRWVTTADEFQAATGITDQQKEQMFHCNSSAWSTGWTDGDYTSLWGTDAESVTPGNLYKVYQANKAFLYLLNCLTSGDSGSGWSEEEAMEKWSEYVHDADGSLRTKYRIIVETGGVYRDPDGRRRAYTLREAMAYSLYNSEPQSQYSLIWDQSASLVNQAQWMRQAKDQQFVEYPLDENGAPTGEELHSTNGFRECDSYVDTIQYARPMRDTIFSERRSFGLHIFSPFNFESQPAGVSLEVTKKTGSGLPSGREWGFTVKYTEGTPTQFSATKNGADCTSLVANTGSSLKFSLKADETIRIVFQAAPSFRYEVTEDDPSSLTSITGIGGTADMMAKKVTSTGGVAKVIFTNGTTTEKKPVYLKLKKIAQEDKHPLSGAEFSVYADSSCGGTPLAVMTTGSDGNASTSVPNVVEDGGSVTLYVKETKAPAGCTPLPTPFPVTCKAPENSTLAGAVQVGPAVGIENGGGGGSGSSLLFKRDANTNAGVGPATFKFSSVVNGVYEFDTNSSGELEAIQWWDPTETAGKYIKPGEYAVTEIVPPPNYLPTTEVQQIKLELDADGNPIPAGPLVFKNLAKVGLRVVKYDRLSHQPMNGVTFEIFRDGTSIGRYETKGQGEILLTNIEPGTYRVVEVDTGDEGHIMDGSYQEIELVAGGGTKDLIFYNDKKPGMKLVKVDSADPSKTISGAKFRIRAVDGSFGPQEFVTDGSGEIDLSNLPTGAYEVTEVECAGYVIDDAQRIIHLQANDTAQFVFTNTRKPGFKLFKTSADGTPLDGVTFRIARIEDGSRYLDRTTQNGGEISVEGLEPGIYSVQETATLSDHILDKTEYHVELSPGKISELRLKNDKRPYLTIAKVEQGTGTPIPGTKFRIEGIDSDYQHDVTTGSDGTVTIQVDPGAYRITEKDVPEPYCLPEDEADRVQTVSLNPNDNKTLTFKNSKKPLLTISKTDADTGKVVPGTVFEVKGIDNDYQDDWTTGADGKVAKRVNPGTYRVTEKHVPAPYYLPDKDADRVQTISLNPGDEKTLFFKNHRTPELTIYKVDSVAGAPIEGAKFHVTYTSNGESADAPASMNFGFFITDEKGEIRLHEKGKKLYPGEYTVTEVEPAPGFQMKEPTTQKVILHGGESKTLTFSNEPLNAIIVEKYDSVTHEALPGCTFQLRFLGGTSGTGGTIIGQKVTGQNGTCIWTGLTAGTYQVEEIDPADGYSIINASETVYISDDGKQSVVTVKFDNAPDGILLIRKVCSVNPSMTLQDAEFKVTYADGTLIGDSNGIYRTDEHGEIRIEGLKPGKSVIVTEVKAPDGFIIDTQSQTVQIKEGRTVSLTFANQPRGKLIIQKRDSQTNAPLSGAEFRVTTAAGCEVGLDGVIGTATLTQNGLFTTDSNGEIRISNLAPGAYVLTETKVPVGYVMDAPSTNVVIGPNGDTQTVIVTNTPKATLTITKRDAVTRKPLANAEFVVRDSEGHAVGPTNGIYQTGTDGTVIVSGLEPGATIMVSETKAPTGYILDETPKSIVVKSGTSNSLIFDNQPGTTLIIRKFIEGTENEPLSGVCFRVTDGAGAAVGPDDGRYYTDKAGEIVLEGLEPGTTVIAREVRTVDGFVLDGTPQSIKIEAGQASQLTFWNRRAGNLIINKVDGIDKHPLAGVRFKITYADGSNVDQDGDKTSTNGMYVTDSSGQIKIYGIVGTVVITEVETIPGYYIKEEYRTRTVEIKPNDTQTITVYNIPTQALVIQKYTAGDKGAPLAGVEFLVTDSDGTLIGPNNGIFKTDALGRIIIKGLPPGTVITARETKAPDGYILDSTPQSIEIKSGEVQSLKFYNTPAGGLTIIKKDEETGERISGVQFEIRKLNGEIIGTYTTDRNGVIILPQAEKGWYQVTELKAAKGYRLDARPYQVEVKDGGTATLEITNRQAGSAIIHKVDSLTGEGIYGVKFLVSDAKGNPIGTYESDNEGYVYIDKDLADGKYTVRELECAQGYILDTVPKTFYVEYGGCTTITWPNTAVRGQIQIVKKSAEYNSVNGLPAGTLLEGATFEIYNEHTGNRVDTIVTGANGLAASKQLPLGRYTIRETKAPANYGASTDSYTAVLEYSGQIVRLEITNKSLSTGVSIEKAGPKEAMSGQPVRYVFSRVGNTSNVMLQSFYWRDTLPAAVRLDKIVTGTYNFPGTYKIVYKVNNTGDYRTLADSLSTSRNYTFAASPAALGLASNEWVTEVMFVFGQVPGGFSQVEAPMLHCIALPGLAPGSSFANVADVGGTYNGVWVQGVTRWVTTVYGKPTPLPRTGY